MGPYYMFFYFCFCIFLPHASAKGKMSVSSSVKIAKKVQGWIMLVLLKENGSHNRSHKLEGFASFFIWQIYTSSSWRMCHEMVFRNAGEEDCLRNVFVLLKHFSQLVVADRLYINF